MLLANVSSNSCNWVKNDRVALNYGVNLRANGYRAGGMAIVCSPREVELHAEKCSDVFVCPCNTLPPERFVSHVRIRGTESHNVYNVARAKITRNVSHRRTVTVIFYDIYPVDCIMTVILWPAGIGFRM